MRFYIIFPPTPLVPSTRPTWCSASFPFAGYALPGPVDQKTWPGTRKTKSKPAGESAACGRRWSGESSDWCLQKAWNEWQEANQRQKALGPLSWLLNGDLVGLVGEGQSARYYMKREMPDHLRHLQGMYKKMFFEEHYRLLMDEGSIRSKAWLLK
ncbi:MAG: hypothetical protein M1826_003930 [Phylliscum demangeonii]|nr:MAG: hypothetical protein M1826_003930 [Phylliscum demangeonii]